MIHNVHLQNKDASSSHQRDVAESSFLQQQKHEHAEHKHDHVEHKKKKILKKKEKSASVC